VTVRSPSTPVRFGIISTAAINKNVLAGVAGSTEVEVTAIASRSPDAAVEYARAHGLQRAHGSYEALLADPDIDAVYIPLPNSLHVEWAISALEAGKHVLCEKPLSRRAAEVERAFAAADRAGRILTEAFMYRHHPQTKLFAELVAGEIGELRTVRAALGGTMSDPGNVRMRTDLDGGAMMDVGCYCVSFARLLAGEPKLAIGTQIVGPSGTDTRFAGLLTFPGDVIATFDCGFDLAATSFVEAVGSAGTVRAQDPFLLHDSAIELTPDGGPSRRIEVPAANSYRLEFENLAAAIDGRGEPLLGHADALGQASTIEALQRSAENGSQPIAVN
jgi:D-xylose 1-dehydrogenase (NADP+, D-xylono-1,5-lactone-forming)